MRGRDTKPTTPKPVKVDFGGDRTSPGILQLDAEAHPMWSGGQSKSWIDALLDRIRERKQ